MLHAVFHRTLVGADFVIPTLHQSFTTRVHAFGDFVIFYTSFHVSGLLRFNKLALESNDLFRVVKLHHIECFTGANGMQSGNRQHMWIPLDHDVGVVGEPNSTTVRQFAVAVFQQYVVPLLVCR